MNCPNCRAFVSRYIGYNHEPEFDRPEYMGNWNSIFPVFIIAGLVISNVEIRTHDTKEHPWIIRVRHFYKCDSCNFEWDSMG